MAASGSHPYDPAKPWDRCFDIAPQQHNYWQKYITIPCLIIVSSAKAAESFLDGDAPVAGGGDSHIATSYNQPVEIGLAAYQGSGEDS